MSEMISICGLKCHECGAFIARRDDDHKVRAETAAIWSKMYGAELKPESINCDGCTSEGGVVFHHCTVCEMRKCAKGRGVVNCAHCSDYACDTLNEFFKMVPEAKETLDAIRATL
jgi:hypothetical protein